MPQGMCRECHRLVSEEANACPHCGVRRPVATEGAFEPLPPYTGALLPGLGVAAVGGSVVPIPDRPIGPGVRRAGSCGPCRTSRGVPRLPVAGPGMWLGAPLFGRESRAYVGRITSLTCPQHHARVSGVTCLEIEFADGRRAWVERSRAETQYLTPRITN